MGLKSLKGSIKMYFLLLPLRNGGQKRDGRMVKRTKELLRFRELDCTVEYDTVLVLYNSRYTGYLLYLHNGSYGIR